MIFKTEHIHLCYYEDLIFLLWVLFIIFLKEKEEDENMKGIFIIRVGDSAGIMFWGA